MTTKKRKTRLKGTETEKPCFDCGKTKDRFKDFKPRWAGCVAHRTERGRRYLEPGCADCKALVNGNIRQPRCIECDKQRPKKRKAAGAKAKATPKPKAKATPKPVTKVNPTPAPKAEPVAEATPVVVPTPAPKAKKGKQPKTSQKPKRPKLATMADLSALFADED